MEVEDDSIPIDMQNDNGGQVCVNCSEPLPFSYLEKEDNFISLTLPFSHKSQEHQQTPEETVGVKSKICEFLIHSESDCDSLSKTETHSQGQHDEAGNCSVNTTEDSDFLSSTTTFNNKKIKINNVLSSIYQLHYLDHYPQLDDDDPLDDLIPPIHDSASLNQNFENSFLCLPCAQVLVNLYKYFEQFNQLRKVNSLLANKIRRLDRLFKEHHQQIHSQNLNQRQRQSISASSAAGGGIDAVIKCEVLAEEGNEEIIFADDNDDDRDDNHFDVDIDIFSQDQEDPHEALELQLGFESGDKLNNEEEVSTSTVEDKHLLPLHKNECRDPVSAIAPPTSSSWRSSSKLARKNTIVVPSKGPWVKLNRLTNVKEGSPIDVSHLQDDSHHSGSSNGPGQHSLDSFENLVVKAGQRMKSEISYQADDIFLDSSGPSDNDDSNDSDFQIEYDSRATKTRRNPSLRSSRKSSLKRTTTATVTQQTQRTSTNPHKLQNLKQRNSFLEVGDDNSATNTSTSMSLDFVDNDNDSLQGLDQEQDEDDGSSSSCDSFYEPESKKRKSNPKRNPRKTKGRAPKATTTNKKATRKSEKRRNRAPKPILEDPESRKERKKQEKKVRDRIDKGYRRRKVRVPNPCWHCPLDFPTQEECYAHTKATHFNPGDFFCSKCSRVCHNKNSFSQHQKICEQLCPGQKLAPYPCPHCNKRFAFKSYLDSHLPVHNAERSFSCSKCDFKAKSNLLINNHFNRMHVDHPKFRYKVGPNGEMSEQCEPIIYKCDHCENTFKNDHSRRIHMVKLHTEEGFKKYRQQQRVILDRQKEERRARIAKKNYICTECNIDFFSNLRLICHRKTMHMVEKKFVCEQCGKDFSRSASLRYHITYSHSDSRPFICEHCGKAFKTVYNLKDHVKHTHSEEGRLQYNQFMRRHNQRRKIVAEALAKKTIQAGDSNNTSNESRLQSTETISYGQLETEATLTPTPVSASSSASSSSVSVSPFYPGSSGHIQKLVDNWTAVNPLGVDSSALVAGNVSSTVRMLDLLMPQIPQ